MASRGEFHSCVVPLEQSAKSSVKLLAVTLTEEEGRPIREREGPEEAGKVTKSQSRAHYVAQGALRRNANLMIEVRSISRGPDDNMCPTRHTQIDELLSLRQTRARPIDPPLQRIRSPTITYHPIRLRILKASKRARQLPLTEGALKYSKEALRRPNLQQIKSGFLRIKVCLREGQVVFRDTSKNGRVLERDEELGLPFKMRQDIPIPSSCYLQAARVRIAIGLQGTRATRQMASSQRKRFARVRRGTETKRIQEARKLSQTSNHMDTPAPKTQRRTARGTSRTRTRPQQVPQPRQNLQLAR